MTKSAVKFSLVADVGGTNTRMAFADGQTLLPETVKRFRNAEFAAFGDVLRRYLDDAGVSSCAAVCVAVAGPVADGRATLTNLDWSFDFETLEAECGTKRVALLNDLEALAYALDGLDVSGQTPVVQGNGKPKPKSAKLVIGAGTGFNAAALVSGRKGQGRFVNSAECGHIGMPVQSEEDCRLMSFLRAIDGFASVEDVLSGQGLENCYAWVSSENGQETRLPAATIAGHIKDRTDPLAVQAGKTFARIAASVSSDLALTFLPFGGIYLAGGVMRALAPMFEEYGFRNAFYDKGRFSEYLEQFSIWVVEDDYAALSGCAAYVRDA